MTALKQARFLFASGIMRERDRSILIIKTITIDDERRKNVSTNEWE